MNNFLNNIKTWHTLVVLVAVICIAVSLWGNIPKKVHALEKSVKELETDITGVSGELKNIGHKMDIIICLEKHPEDPDRMRCEMNVTNNQ